MDSMLNRYRSVTLLLVVLVAQLIFLAYQVKTDNDVRVIRVWAVTAITPIAQVAETTRSTIYGVFNNYFDLHNAREENRRMRSVIDKLKLENHYLQNELSTADRVKALAVFEKQTPSRMLAARIIGTATTSASKIVFLDRGSNSEVEKGMAVITPDGIVGVVLDAYPTASQALLATDPGFAAGVVSQKNHVRGILRGIGSGKCKVDMVQNEEKVDVGEAFFTSGDDRIFPRGLPVGKADVVREGSQFKDILVYPTGLQNGPEEVLIVLNGIHQLIPEHPDREETQNEPLYMGKPAPEPKQAAESKPALSTEADRLVDRYKKIGSMEGHRFGEGTTPNFNVPVPAGDIAKPAAAAAAGTGAAAATPGIKAAAPGIQTAAPGIQTAAPGIQTAAPRPKPVTSAPGQTTPPAVTGTAPPLPLVRQRPVPRTANPSPVAPPPPPQH